MLSSCCGPTVSVTELANGCVLILVSGQDPVQICPGSNVSFAEDENNYYITIDGETHPMRKDINVQSFALIENTLVLTETDGTVHSVVLPEPPEDIHVQSFARVGDNLILTETNGNVFSVVLPADQQDIHIQSFVRNGNNLVITETDGSTHIVALPEQNDNTQTRVTRGTGNIDNTQTLTANHNGTWANTVWRETYMKRNGDIVVINSWNPTTNSWDSVAIEAPENLVILNNPVIYVNANSGSASPPIEKQTDLTPSNAFNSFDAVRSFMTRTLVVGTVTLDCIGDFSSGTRRAIGTINPSLFKNAQNIIIRGNGGNADTFVLPVGFIETGRSQAILVTAGNVTLRDVTLFSGNTSTAAVNGAGHFMQVTGGQLTLDGDIKLTGTFNMDRAGASGVAMARVTEGVLYVLYDTVFTIDLTAGSKLGNFFNIGAGGTLTVHSDVILQIERDLILSGAVTLFSSASKGIFSGAPGRLVPLTFSGAGKFIAPQSIRVNDLASVNFAANMYGSRSAAMAWDWGARVSVGGATSVALVSAVGVVNEIAGP